MTAPGFDRTPAASGPLVQGFALDAFLIDGARYRSALLTPEKAEHWDAPPVAALAPGDVAAALAMEPAPEFLILGTGPVHCFAPRGFVAALEAKGIGVEAMDSRAAARMWGLLRSEGRWIAAALMPF